MSIRGFDVATDTTGHAHEIAMAGYLAVGVYLRADRCEPPMIRGLRSVGINIWSIWERGEPTSIEYFEQSGQGIEDGKAACMGAAMLQQPPHTLIFPCVDYDALPSHLDAIKRYQADFRSIVEDHGFLPGIYSSGLVCMELVGCGLAHAGWLDQSSGHAGHAEYSPHAAIIQGPSARVCGFDVDLDTVVDSSVLWYPVVPAVQQPGHFGGNELGG